MSIISSNTGNAADEAAINSIKERAEENSSSTKNKLGIALVGLGKYSEGELGPALKETEHCELVGVVSGDVRKREKWRKQYNLKAENLYDYENFDMIKSSRDIDIVYIVLPNSMHADFVIRAAQAGKHVICEKPMATNLEDCHKMIDACKKAGVKLSMGYRLHFEPYNQEMMRLGQNNILGPVLRLIAQNNMPVGKKNQWRLNHVSAGGGPLMDVGIYCVQGVLYSIGALPIAVTARYTPTTDPQKFETVEEGLEWEMEFPGGVKATCETSYNKEANLLRAETASGWFELQPAYEYRGLKGNTSESSMTFPQINQQAAQMDDFARCIKSNEESRVPGEMGLRDMHILLAIYEAADTGKRVSLKLEAFENLMEV